MLLNRVQVLVSTMNQTADSMHELITSMGLSDIPAVIVCQKSPELDITQLKYENITFVIDDGVGLSRSRNLAITAASREFCILADDDMHYTPELLCGVVETFDDQPGTVLLLFNVLLPDGNFFKRKHTTGSVSIIDAFRVSSVQLGFRRESIISSGMKFDEAFGAGTENLMTEENIFIADALRAGLTIRRSEKVLGTLLDSSSTGDRSHTNDVLRAKGRGFFRISPALALLYATFFTVTKRHLYRGQSSVISAFFSLVAGIVEQGKKAVRGSS